MNEQPLGNDALLREFLDECRRLWGRTVIVDLHWASSGKWLANVQTARGFKHVQVAYVFVTDETVKQLKRCEQKGDWQ